MGLVPKGCEAPPVRDESTISILQNMNKKLLISLANLIRDHNAAVRAGHSQSAFDGEHISTLADFCARENPAFKRDRWVDYIAGKCGPNGGPAKGGNAS